MSDPSQTPPPERKSTRLLVAGWITAVIFPIAAFVIGAILILKRGRPGQGLGMIALGAVVGIAVIVSGSGSSEDNSTASSSNAIVEQDDSSDDTQAIVAEEEPEPTPDPEVSVNYTGPDNVHSDNVLLKGTVDPANA